MTVRIVTDSTCDLAPEVIAAHRITVVPLYVNFGAQSFLDGVDLTRQEFYDRLQADKTAPTTSAPGPDAFVRTYEQLVAEGASGVLSVHIAGSVSNTVNVARLAAESRPDLPVRVVDSGQITLGVGLLVLHAARAAEGGASLKALAELVEGRSGRTHAFAALDTLEFLRRSGRVSGLASGLGTLLQLKPLIKMHRGQMGLERARTRQGAFDKLLELGRALGPLEELALVHTRAVERVAELGRAMAGQVAAGAAPLVGEVTPVIGAHVGPGAIGLVCVQAGQERAEERPRND